VSVCGAISIYCLRRISGQNSFTTIINVSYPTCVPHIFTVFSKFRFDLGW
jgi:hypothetical protein